MSGVQLIEIAPGEGDQRLDRWFRRRFPQVSQGRIEKMCRKGEIRLDGGRVKAATRVEVGQMVRVPPVPDVAAPARTTTPQISDADAKMIQRAVLYRDDHILALNKPPGLPSQGGSKQLRHVDGLAEALCFDAPEKPRLVHRLDKDTSGVLLMARTREVAAALGQAFRSRDARKIYWAAVAGQPKPNMGTIRFGLVKAGGDSEKMQAVHPDAVSQTDGAKHATTDYAVLSALGTRASWVAMAPITGRTHQLRAHMAAIGHPIAGDGKYGGSSQENKGDGWGAQLGGEISRKLHLHARSLTFIHPVTGNTMMLMAHLPPHMKRTWDMFGWVEGDVPDDPFDPEGDG